LQGISGGFIGVVIPLYLAECLSASARGKGTGIFQWLLTLGIAAAALIGLYFSNRVDEVAKMGDADKLFAFKDVHGAVFSGFPCRGNFVCDWQFHGGRIAAVVVSPRVQERRERRINCVRAQRSRRGLSCRRWNRRCCRKRQIRRHANQGITAAAQICDSVRAGFASFLPATNSPALIHYRLQCHDFDPGGFER